MYVCIYIYIYIYIFTRIYFPQLYVTPKTLGEVPLLDVPVVKQPVKPPPFPKSKLTAPLIYDASFNNFFMKSCYFQSSWGTPHDYHNRG